MLAYLFPGQGSQRKGMGGELFDQITEFGACESDIDKCLGYSLRQLCLEDPDNGLRQTQKTQPCLYVVNSLYYYKEIANGEQPDYLAGHSVGEYNALMAAGAFDFLTGLQLVKRRGEIMAHARNGGMAAVVGLTANRVSQVIRDNGLYSLDVANYNSPSQTVVAGPTEDIIRAASVFKRVGAQLYVQLPVSAAFHSRYMQDAQAKFAEYIASVSFKQLRIPVISNVTGEPYPSGDPSSILRSLLTKQIAQSVQWVQGVRYMIGKGVNRFRELGPGTVLTKLVEQTKQTVNDRWSVALVR
jgi:malonyl CoA-acyl carrier protein transacylase